MGAEGGKETFRRHGRKHMQEIGARGFATLVARKFAGDKGAAVAWLHAHAAESLIDRLVAEKLDQQIDEGATCAVEELPIILWPDDDFSFDEPEPEPSWRERVSPRPKGARAR
jgi:hypothetical protein